MGPIHPSQKVPMDLLTFLTLQLERIRGKPQTQVPGPKRPDLEAIDKGKLK